MQYNFVYEILTKYKDLQNKPKDSPLHFEVRQGKMLEADNMLEGYKNTISSLIYLTISTRLDLAINISY